MPEVRRLQSISLEDGDHDDSNAEDEETPLDVRVIQVVKSCAPDRTIRPARLAAALGLSMTDACAELCGLMAAVGGGADGASFRFEKIDDQQVMVFTFPADFERRAAASQRRKSWREGALRSLYVSVKVLKVVTAFGLILSLIILAVAAMVGLVAVLVAVSREGGAHQRNAVTRQIQSLFYTLRQLLWCYAVFGSEREGQDPFMRELAYDFGFMLSMFSGNPFSMFFWWRRSSRARLRSHASRGWGGDRGYAMASQVEGVSLIRNGQPWSEEERAAEENSHRGVLSTAVEYLFGPTPFQAGPTEAEKWKLRAAVLMDLSSKSQGEGVSLEALWPYVDEPPSLEDPKLIDETLLVVAHFNGVPKEDASDCTNLAKARFVFPELMAESRSMSRFELPKDNDNDTWAFFLFDDETSSRTSLTTVDIPSHLKERRYRFTKLPPMQLLHCVSLGLLNFAGVFWFGMSIGAGGVLELQPGSTMAAVLQKGLLPVLKFYAILFFVLPGCRLVLLLALNSARRKRNKRRAALVGRSLTSS